MQIDSNCQHVAPMNITTLVDSPDKLFKLPNPHMIKFTLIFNCSSG